MGIFDRPSRIGRRRHEPTRETVPYAKLANIFGGWNGGRDRPIIKATPSNLRRFSRTVYVRRAIKVIKDTIATRPFEVGLKKDAKANPELDRQIEVVSDCFSRPNRDDSWRSLLEQTIEDICVCGAGAVEQQVGGDLIRPLWLWPVDALTIQIVPTWNGSDEAARYWQTLGYGNVGVAKGKALRNDELVYMRYDPTTENPFGLGPVEVAFNTINRILSAADFAGNVAGNAIPANLMMFKGASPEDIETVRAYWQNEIEGQGKMPIFGFDEIKGISLRGNDDKSLFLAWQEFLIREIAAAFGISPQNLAVERDVNRDTAEVAEDRDYRQTIIPIATLVTSYFNREVIEGRMGFSQIELRILGLDREDELDTAKILDYRFKQNSITPNEIRARFGEPPMDGPWGDMTWADIQIAISAARGAKVVDDPELEELNNPAQAIVQRRNRKKTKGA